jgi:hypothetical protein
MNQWRPVSGEQHDENPAGFAHALYGLAVNNQTTGELVKTNQHRIPQKGGTGTDHHTPTKIN